MPAANGNLPGRVEIDEKAKEYRPDLDAYDTSSQWMLKSLFGSHHIARGVKPAAIASVRKPSGVYLYEFSVWIVSPCRKEIVRPAIWTF
jgi:hypothetical protein